MYLILPTRVRAHDPSFFFLPERCLVGQISYFVESNNLIFSRQHGFRNKYSCETALHSSLHEIACNLDDKHVVDGIFLDFSKAFDTVPHRQGSTKLGFGVLGFAGFWGFGLFFERFFDDKSLRICSGSGRRAKTNTSLPYKWLFGFSDFLSLFFLQLFCKIIDKNDIFLVAGSNLNTV